MRKIVWKGFFEGDTGYINATKRYPLALRKKGFDVGIFPLSPMQKNNPLVQMIYQPAPGDKALSILHQIPTVSPNEEAYFTVTEFNIPPHEWWQSLENAKFILTQSEFCRKSFAKVEGVDINKIHIVHYPLPPEMTPEGPVKVFPEKHSFVFGSIFEWVARKKPELMWQAFTEEFPIKEYPDIAFYNRMSIPKGFDDWKYQYNVGTKKDPRIKVIVNQIDNMPDFYRALDCYVSPTAGEGWGATLCEAMACGVPTIGSNHGGNLEFMNENNSYLVDVADWSPVGNDLTNHLWMIHAYQKWKLPKVESIRKQMRSVYEKKIRCQPNHRAKEGEKVRELLSMDAIANQLEKALKNYV